MKHYSLRNINPLPFIWAMMFIDQCTSMPPSEVLSKLLENYDKRVVPIQYNRQPVQNSIKLIFLNMVGLKESQSHYTAEFILHQRWQDHRLVLNTSVMNTPIILMETEVIRLWRPDLTIPNIKHGERSKITRENSFAQLFRNGTLIWSQRLLCSIYCNMDMTKYPNDHQVCPLQLESYAYNVHYMNLRNPMDNSALVKMPKTLQTGKFHLLNFKFDIKKADYGEAGTFNRIEIDLYLARVEEGFILLFYVPLNLMVTVSWASFWIDYRSAPARTSIGAAAVLSMVSTIMSIQRKLPPHQGESARYIDVYMLVCFLFVFATLVEYAAALSVDLKVRELLEVKGIRQDAITKTENFRQTGWDCTTTPEEYSGKLESTTFGNDWSEENKPMEVECNEQSNYRARVGDINKDLTAEWGTGVWYQICHHHLKQMNDYHVLDKISRVVFPISFAFFNLGYFLMMRFC